MMQPDGYGAIPMDLHISQQGYHPYYRKGHEDAPGPPIVQTRILEMRKEKSRDAARSRRGKENYEFYELAKMLPLPGAITTQLDKASIIRLTISYLKLKEFTARGDPPWRKEQPKGGSLRSRSMQSTAIDLFEQHQATHILQSLDGFAFALGSDGRFLYISETVSIYLGLSQVEMTGSSVFDYIHAQDQSELADLIGISSCASPASPVASDEGSSSNPDRPAPTMTLPSNNQSLLRSFCIRMKSTLTKRGCHFKSSGYRVVLVLSHLRPQFDFSPTRKQQPPQQPQIAGLVAVAIALPPPSVNELRLEADMFVTRLTFDFRVSHCEPRVSELLDYTAEEVTGLSLYTLCHAQDVERLRKCHVDLLQKGQSMSGYYRLMSKSGGHAWLQSCATIVCNAKNAEEETIVCVNYVLSAVEYPHCVMDSCQLPGSRDHIRSRDDPSGSEGGTSPDHKEGGPVAEPPGDADSAGPNVEEDTGLPRDEQSSDHKLREFADCFDPSKREEEPEVRHRKRKNSLPDQQQQQPDPHLKSPRGNGNNSPRSDVMDDRGASSPDRGGNGGGVARPWTRSPAVCGVRDLEDVVNRHLPDAGSPRPPLQWPATTLLRQIYVSRESVIRSATQQTPPYCGDVVTKPLPDPAYNCMTPPSSVSPRDFGEAAAAAAAAAMPHMRHPPEPHLKPPPPHQLFVHPGDYQHAPELYHHPSSFHLYHPGGAAKSTGLNGTSWFCQPHS